MSTRKKIAIAVIALMLCGLGAFLIPTLWGKPWSIEHFYIRVFAEFALERPQLLSRIRILEPYGLDFHNDDLDDYSVEGELRSTELAREALATLRSYDRESLDDQLSYDILEPFLELSVEEGEFAFHNYPVNQSFGLQSDLPEFMISVHRIDDRDGAEDYLTRLAKLGVALDQILDGLRYREERGVIPPRFVITKVIAEMRDFIAAEPDKNPLVEHFVGELAKLEDLSAEQAEAMQKQAVATVGGIVYPAYQRLINYHVELEPRATEEAGVWKLPDGDRYYAHELRFYTTTRMSAEEIHRLGREEVARLEHEMLAILAAEGYSGDSVGAIAARLAQEPRFFYADTDAGRQAILDDYTSIIEEVDKGLDALFGKRPRVGVVVERVPEFKQATAPGAYYFHPPFDGSRPGTFFVNLRDTQEIAKFGMRTLAYHEAIPGHHFQIALAQEIEGVPFFRRLVPFTAYAEGWALYAERLAAENGYQKDPFDRLGYLTSEMFRAVRLVVDTGIHHYRWTREQAIAYMIEKTGMSEGEVTAEIERYIVTPGQACAYKVGQLKILELRERARAALGDRFDLRDFHDVVLGSGAMPLDVLERRVDEWLAEAS